MVFIPLLLWCHLNSDSLLRYWYLVFELQLSFSGLKKLESLNMRYCNYIADSDIKYLSGRSTTVCFMIFSALVCQMVRVKLRPILWIDMNLNSQDLRNPYYISSLQIWLVLVFLQISQIWGNCNCLLVELQIWVFLTLEVNNDYNMPLSS
jgi:hypothetical protein